MKVNPNSWLAIVALALMTTLMVVILVTQPARAAGPWYVATTGSDSNSCLSSAAPCATINGAIGKASSGDTIYVATGTYTASAGSEVVLINKDITLSGGWNGGFTTQSGMATIDGEGARRGMTVNGGIIATIDRFTIQNGNFVGYGGGIYNAGTSLAVNNSSITNNTATGDGGGNSYGGGINTSGTMTLSNSTVSGNTASAGGGIYNSNYNASGFHNPGVLTLDGDIIVNNTATVGGGIYNVVDGSMILNYSTLSNNMARVGGGIYNGGASMTINNSIVSGNSAVNGWGGGIYQTGFMTLTLNNTTISSNTAGIGGGGIASTVGALILNSSTVTSNSVTNGGGGGVYGGVTLQDSILALNTGTGLGPDCNGTISSLGYNLIGNNSGCAITGPTTGNLINVDSKLGPLQNNGGPTPTHALLAGSPAINAGNPAGCVDNLGNTLNKDQRGLTRFGRCDIGAYEEQAIKAVNNPIAQPGSTMTYTIAFHNGEINPLAGVWMTDTLPASITYTNNSLTATSGSYGYDAGVITWTGTISADEIITITFAVGVSQGLPLNVPITNTAVINDGSTVFNRTATMLVAYQLFFPLIKR